MEHTLRDSLEDIEKRLAQLRIIPPRDSQSFSQGRAAFLLQARQLKGQDDGRLEDSYPAGLTSRNGGRQTGQIYKSRKLAIQDLFRAKERSAVFTSVMTALVVIALLFGGVGATAYAAQDSLPDDALYPVKTLAEDVQLGLSARDQSRLDLDLTFSERRVGEMAALIGLGIDLPAAVANRLGEKVEAALNIAATLKGQAQQEALGQILTRMQAQEQILAGLEAANRGSAVLTQAHQNLDEQLRLAAQGLSDPQGLQQQLQQRARTRAWEVQEPDARLRNDNDNGNGIGNVNLNANGNSNANDNENANENCDGANCNDNAGANANEHNGVGGNTNTGKNNDNGANVNDHENGDSSDDDGNENGSIDDVNGNENGNSNDSSHDGNDNGDDHGDSGDDEDRNANINGGSGDNDNDSHHGNDNGGDGGGDNENGGSGGGNYNDSGGSGGDGHTSIDADVIRLAFDMLEIVF